MNIIDIMKLSLTKLILFISLLYSNLLSGVLSIYLFDRNTFDSIDSIKLLLLAMAITLPSSCMASCCVVLRPRSKEEEQEYDDKTKNLVFLFESAIVNIIVMMIAIINGFLEELSFRQFYISLMELWVLFLVFTILQIGYNKYIKKSR